ncbi:MAG: peptidoglycan-associated lipoprotein Pal [Deltaproteobacteria bacterium]|nr:MAG: peptidoglycan-associated lipoprotein Pal [Deltaproteobacteria bacterium]
MKGTKFTMLTLLGVLFLWFGSGCYKTPPELEEAKKALQKAAEAEAPKYAPEQYKSAEELLQQAEKADVEKEEDECREKSIAARDAAENAYKAALEEAERQRRLAQEEAERKKREAEEAERRRREEEAERRRQAMLEQQRKLKLSQINNMKIHFDFDKADIRPDAEPVLRQLAELLREFPNKPLTIEGHCDERGSEEYNLALGERRAEAAKRYLMSLGIDENRIETISYGESRPIDPASNEEAWAKNRRAEFKVPVE